VAAIPQWFKNEVLRRLTGVRGGKEPGQFYARCPAHDDQHASLAIKPGDSMPLVYHCHAVPGCDQVAIRDALAGLGIPDEYLGQYGTPQYEARRQARTAVQEWREVERLRYELADLRNGIRGLLVADLSMALLKVRILAVVDDVDIPADRKDYVAFAMRAGVSQPRAYAAWKADPLGAQAQECVSVDHVVLAQPGESRQASQVAGHDEILEPIKVLSNREGQNSRTDNSRNEKSKLDLTGDEAA
jgi:hypothetical protein